MRGKVFDMLFNVLERDNHSLESLTLNETTQKKVDFHIIDYINSLNDLKENNIPINRGIILSGPPGTGKTLIVKDVINRTQLTTIVITTAMLSKYLVSDAYRIARKLAPCIVVLETSRFCRRNQQKTQVIIRFLVKCCRR